MRMAKAGARGGALLALDGLPGLRVGTAGSRARRRLP